jgi:hypothetical protein
MPCKDGEPHEWATRLICKKCNELGQLGTMDLFAMFQQQTTEIERLNGEVERLKEEKKQMVDCPCKVWMQ